MSFACHVRHSPIAAGLLKKIKRRRGKERKGQHKERSRLIIVDELVRAELTHSLDIQTEPPWQGGDQDDEGVCRLQAV